MKKLFTTMLVSMFAMCSMAQLSIWYNGEVVYYRDYSQIDSITFGKPTIIPDGDSQAAWSAEQTKEYLMDVAKRMIQQFNTADQKAVIDLADGFYRKYQEYSWQPVGKYYEDRFDYMFRMPRYATDVARGKKSPTAVDQSYLFSFAGESAIFEADDATRTWKYVGKSSDNSVILRCKDINGVTCEARAWGEGNTKTYGYTWNEYRWVYPKIYAPEGTSLEICYYGYYNGVWHEFYTDNGTSYYFYGEDGRPVNIAYSDISDLRIEGRDSNYNWYQYEESTGKWYRNDYENGYKEYQGKRTISGEVPDKMFVTLKQGSNEVMRIELTQEMAKNDHMYFTIYVKLANLTWTSDIKVNSNHGSAAFEFKYGNKSFFSGIVNLPVYELIAKQDNQDWEDWANEYGDRYDELLRKIGSADGAIDFFGEVQLKAKINNFGYAYRDFLKWDERSEHSSRASVEQFCSIFNDNAVNGIYYNSDVRQAIVRVQPAYDESDESFYPEGVLYFPKDKTSYAFEQYFDRKPFTDLQYMVEDLVNAYIKLSQSLYEEVGNVSFEGGGKNEPVQPAY